MIYLNFLSGQLNKNKYVKAIKEWLPVMVIATMLIFAVINIVLYAAPIILNFVIQSIDLTRGLITGNLSTTDVFGGNVFTLIIILTMPISIVIFLKRIGIGGFRGDYGIY